MMLWIGGYSGSFILGRLEVSSLVKTEQHFSVKLLAFPLLNLKIHSYTDHTVLKYAHKNKTCIVFWCELYTWTALIKCDVLLCRVIGKG